MKYSVLVLKSEEEKYKADNEIQDYRGGGRKQSRLYRPDKKTKLYLEPRGHITTSVKVRLSHDDLDHSVDPAEPVFRGGGDSEGG